jgi:hypothetical protein
MVITSAGISNITESTIGVRQTDDRLSSLKGHGYSRAAMAGNEWRFTG